MNFKGTFKPPAIRISNSPIKIAGPGRCNIRRDGIEISGFQADSAAKIQAALIVALVVALACLFAFAADRLLTAVPPLIIQMSGGAIGGLIYFFIIGGREKHLADRPVELVIPWASIGTASRDIRQPGGIVIEVTKGDPKGTLHFHPMGGGVDLFLDVMRTTVASRDRG